MRIVLMDSRNIVQEFYIDVRIVCTLHSPPPSLSLSAALSSVSRFHCRPPATAHTGRDLNQYTPELGNSDIEHPSMNNEDKWPIYEEILCV